MPELPEVETTRRGLSPHILGRTVEAVVVRQPALRWPVPAGLARRLRGHRVDRIDRRGKYLLMGLDNGTLLMHLGMSGSLRVVERDQAPRLHDHLDICFDDRRCLRLHDPRRFGAVLWAGAKPLEHPLLRDLGPEPLSADFSGAYLHARSRGRKLAVKNFIMDGRVVTGIGNIYANEALFDAGILPSRPAGRVSRAGYDALAEAIRAVLGAAIEQGGTTLRDFVNSNGEPGYFKLQLAVYDRAGEPCLRCGTPLRSRVIGQRSTFYCRQCQR